MTDNHDQFHTVNVDPDSFDQLAQNLKGFSDEAEDHLQLRNAGRIHQAVQARFNPTVWEEDGGIDTDVDLMIDRLHELSDDNHSSSIATSEFVRPQPTDRTLLGIDRCILRGRIVNNAHFVPEPFLARQSAVHALQNLDPGASAHQTPLIIGAT